VGKNKPTPAQKGWIKALTEEGNLVICCHGWLEAKNVIENYLKECKA
jgi:hypothetical protein